MAEDLREISETGLPNMLVTLLKQLVITSDLKSWSIYENQPGIVNLNIRFSTSVNNNMGVSPVELPVTYRKVSPRQVERSRARAVKYRNTECMHSSNTPSPQSPSDVSTKLDYSQPITRSRAKLDIESIRHSDVVDGTQLSPSSDADISVSSIAIHPSPDQSPIMAPVTPSSLQNNSFVIPITLSPTMKDVSSETHSIESQDVATQSRSNGMLMHFNTPK